MGMMLFLQDSQVAGKAITGMVATVAINVLASSIFGVAAFAQPAMVSLFQAGQENALDFYNNVYAAPLFLTALVFVILFIVGGIDTGIAITASGCWPRWTGWVYAIWTTGFVLSNFLLPVGQTVTSGLLFIATVVLALVPAREGQKQSDQSGIAAAD